MVEIFIDFRNGIEIQTLRLEGEIFAENITILLDVSYRMWYATVMIVRVNGE